MFGSLLRLWLLVAGVALGALFPRLPTATMGAAFWALASLMLALLSRRRPSFALAGLLMFGIGCGSIAASVGEHDGEQLATLASRVSHCEATGRILESAGGLGTLALVDHLSCDDEVFERPGTVIIDSMAPAGSPFWAAGWLVPLGTDQFDVARVRAGADAELTIDASRYGSPRGILAVAAAVREGLRSAGRYISPPEAGLIRGLTIGDTEGLSHATVEMFRTSGLSHLLAVSGSNVAIVLGGVMALARRLSFRARVAIGAGALSLFVLVVGPDASVLRAAAMGGVALVALVSGRQAEPLHALGAALLVIVLLRPQIVHSVGLHLSLAATTGIILWASRIAHRAGSLPGLWRIPLAVTLSAQIAVLPLLMGVFGEASVVAPLSNLLVTAAVAPATVFGLIAALTGAVSPRLGGVFLQIAEPFASWILFVGRVASEPSWASLDVPPWMGAATALPVGAATAWALRAYGEPISLER